MRARPGGGQAGSVGCGGAKRHRHPQGRRQGKLTPAGAGEEVTRRAGLGTPPHPGPLSGPVPQKPQPARRGAPGCPNPGRAPAARVPASQPASSKAWDPARAEFRDGERRVIFSSRVAAQLGIRSGSARCSSARLGSAQALPPGSRARSTRPRRPLPSAAAGCSWSPFRGEPPGHAPSRYGAANQEPATPLARHAPVARRRRQRSRG